eukprot:4358743-Alexandrium_andersonii.AAC.1
MRAPLLVLRARRPHPRPAPPALQRTSPAASAAPSGTWMGGSLVAAVAVAPAAAAMPAASCCGTRGTAC